jgi:hypothetical protein
VSDLESFKREHDPRHKATPVEAVYARAFLPTTTTFIVTAAQNATPVVEDWWNVLKYIAREKKAELAVIPLRYKNPTSLWSASQRNEEFWAPELVPYLLNQRHNLNANLTIIGDIKIPPTKSSPLSGFDALSTTHSAIFGHPKLQMLTVPTPASKMAKILTTTGVITQPNYTDSGLGKTAEFHHSLSAILIEVSGKRFYLRQLHYDKKTKSCTDLATRYTATGKEHVRAAALVMGDMHIRFVDAAVARARRKLVKLVRPKVRVWNDTLDSYSCTPHHEGNPFIQQEKQAVGYDDVAREVRQAIKYIAAQQEEGVLEVVVPSNHDDMLTRWVKRVDWKTLSASNADFYLSTALRMRRESKMTKSGVRYPDAFSLYVRDALPNYVKVLDRDESFMVAGVELGMHGDVGPNGARGSRKNLRRIGVKSIIGHAHSPGIEEGCYQTGTSTALRLEYNHGPSGWLNADVLLHEDGKRQIIVYIDGKAWA